MEKNGRKIKIIFFTINIIITLVLLCLSYNEYNSYNNKLKNKDNFKKKFTIINDEESNIKNDIEKIELQINNLNNLQEEINNKKKEVFKLASLVEHKIQSKESNKKIVYLTFDDGPYYNTYKVLNILKEHKIKATFFTTNVNGEYCYDNPNYNCHELYKVIAKDNHTIANHTFTHGWNKGLYASADSFIDAVLKQEELVKSYTGITTNIVRFPGGSSTPGSKKNSMIEKLSEHGYGWVDWTAEDGDGSTLSNYNEGWSKLKYSVTSNIEVVLFHDYHPITTEILPNFINYLEENNYIILPLFYESVMVNKENN